MVTSSVMNVTGLAPTAAVPPLRRCRAAVGGVLKALWAAVDQPAVDRLARYLTDWLGGTDPRLQRTALQVGLTAGGQARVVCRSHAAVQASANSHADAGDYQCTHQQSKRAPG